MLCFPRAAIAGTTAAVLAAVVLALTGPVVADAATTTATTTSATVRSASAKTVFGAGPYLQAASQPARTASQLAASDPAASAAAATIARYPIAIWLGEWYSDASLVSTIRSTQAAAATAGTTPVYVTYAIPDRDCGGYSAGGMTASRYEQWSDLIASTLRGQRAAVIVEPDSLAALSNCPAEADTRYALLNHEVRAFRAAGVPSYLDGGNSNWVAPTEMASRLVKAGVANARGFSSNVSNYYQTYREQAYDEKVSALTGGAHYVIDTSRNGQGWRGGWCNGVGAGLGTTPRLVSDGTALDALLWVKTPGASDGPCNGGPEAGTWFPSYAQSLVANAVLGTPVAGSGGGGSAAPSRPTAAPSAAPAVTRIAGANAYATAASAALGAFPSPDTVFIASRATFADALGAGAAAGHRDAPVLLTDPHTLPAATATALRSMAPSRIVVVGGTAAVADHVLTALRAYAPVTRLAGVNRFATSAAVSAASFRSGVAVAYVATGTNFPDALSGAAVAASSAAIGPMLLVTGTSVPAPIITELTRLQPARIVVLGGTGVIRPGVVSTLARLTASGATSSVVRWSGSDRYGTSAAVSRSAHPTPTAGGTVYVATGSSFPDALAAAPVAGRTGSPLLLVTHDAVPGAVRTEIARLRPARVVVLGGTAAVSAAVAAQL